MTNLKEPEQKLFDGYIDQIDMLENKILEIFIGEQTLRAVGIGILALMLCKQLEELEPEKNNEKFLEKLIVDLKFLCRSVSKRYVETKLRKQPNENFQR